MARKWSAWTTSPPATEAILNRCARDEETWRRHRFIDAEIVDPAACADACKSVDDVLQQAALGSVPLLDRRSPVHARRQRNRLSDRADCRDAKGARFVDAASSATFGDHPALPKVEDVIGRPLSPYAVTKYLNELYADVFARCDGVARIGLRHFNVFGARQDPEGPYAAVIARWARAMLAVEPCVINGDGETSREFCYLRGQRRPGEPACRAH